MFGLGNGTKKLAEQVREVAHPLTGDAGDYDALMDLIGDARFVLIGEASHGTHDFYQERANITKLLIQEKGFNAVAVEADWPDAYRVNCYVRGRGNDSSADEALGGFQRFPIWMWRNTVVLDFVEWLRTHNEQHSQPSVGFYGMDLYSLYNSAEEVLGYLQKVDPEAAQRARYRYSCFQHFGEDTQSYGYSASFGITKPCEDEVVNQLMELQRKAMDYQSLDGSMAEDEYFYAEQNARLVKNAEEYYRTMFLGRVSSWNLRDRHMADTLDALVNHLDGQVGEGQTKVVVWAHNSHLGDASATQMGDQGEWNVGQLVRERWDDAARLVGFSTYTGTVTAASDWGDPGERKRVRPGLRGSYEELFHEVGVPRFMLNLRDGSETVEALRERRLQRAIGVIYRPQTERNSHYFHTRLADQFDAMIHLDETRALQPLEQTPHWHAGEEVPETYPSGI